MDRDKWKTPKALWGELDQQYNFSFDCCADINNCKTIDFSEDFESIKQIGGIMCWMNPPFSIAERMFNHFFSVVNFGVAIYRCDNMETKIWQDIILPNASWIAIPKGRIKYDGFEGNGSRFPSALIGRNVDPPKLKGFTITILKLLCVEE